ncbi:hypothetical protein M467_06135 [Exiguobacterium chiriqhucha RW-2]|jgi:hypothetical protein|uniref:Uncharacterized protein n=1 Tax=Exiguobacterium chiriqhucha RW-2 TaxID=1345023 RepID=U1LX66_9BACL|nr:hypothetical protein M467_06135 [Exiguobacterium chiriqhucha RW-2]
MQKGEVPMSVIQRSHVQVHIDRQAPLRDLNP